jgi:rhodanese-related sulfurtransferase
MKRNIKLFSTGFLIVVAIIGILVFSGNTKTKDVNKQSNTENVLTAKKESQENNNVYKDISSSDAKKLIEKNLTNKNFHIIDVRTADEFAQGHIEKSTNIDFYQSDFEAKISSLDRSGIYLIYCRTGGRSTKALEIFKNNQFKEVYNLLGGYTEYMN